MGAGAAGLPGALVQGKGKPGAELATTRPQVVEGRTA